MQRLAPALAALALLLGRPAHANDTSSELSAGGLVFVKTAAITMQREDLTLSPSKVQVRYEMRNDSATPVTLHVAFPLPPLPVATPDGLEDRTGNAGRGVHYLGTLHTWSPDFLGFQTHVDGRYVQPKVEIRAVLPGGRNITEELRQIGGWWLVLHPQVFDNDDDDVNNSTDYNLGPNILRQLRDLRAIDGDADGGIALWKTMITYHWDQVFKPGVTTIEHAYAPLPGFFYIKPENGRWRGGASEPEKLEQAFCIDNPTRAAMAKLVRNDAQTGGYLLAHPLSYILSTGANWAGPIGTFHLTIDAMQGTDIVKDTRVVSLCTDLPLKQTGKLRFEATAKNYTPKDELRLLLVAPMPVSP